MFTYRARITHLTMQNDHEMDNVPKEYMIRENSCLVSIVCYKRKFTEHWQTKWTVWNSGFLMIKIMLLKQLLSSICIFRQ